MKHLIIEPYRMSKKCLHPLIIILALIVHAGIVNAQEQDFQNWNNISVSKEIVNDLTASFEQELRLNNNASDIKDYITVLGAEYKINKYVKARGLYRLTVSNDIEKGSSMEHRWYGDAMLRYKLDRINFGYRCRYQLSYEDFDVNRWHHLRNRFSVKYDIPKSKILPYAQYEFYYSLNDPIQNNIEKTRYTFGVEYGLTDYLNLSTYYRIQKRRAYGSKPYDRYIVGISVSVEL